MQFDWLISDQLQYSLNVYQFDCSVLRFPIENKRTAQIRTKESTSCFIFLFDISKITKLMKKFEKGHSRYFPGDLMKNLETPRRVGRPINTNIALAICMIALSIQCWWNHIIFHDGSDELGSVKINLISRVLSLQESEICVKTGSTPAGLISTQRPHNCKMGYC